MQAVSYEWIKNQNSTLCKQGYAVITLIFSDKTLILDSRITSAVAAESGRNISSITHKRSYDPMGFSLPVNSIFIELFNYADNLSGIAPYDWIYDDYETEEFTIKIEYGFRLSNGDETIPGGVFKATGSTKDGNMLIIEGTSGLDINGETVVMTNNISDDETVLFELYGSYQENVSYSELGLTSGDENTLQEREKIITGADVIERIESAGIACQATDGVNGISLFNISDDMTASEGIQYITNGTLQRCIISRDDTVVFSENAEKPCCTINQKVMYEKPTTERSSLIKNINVVSKDTETTETNTASLSYRHVSNAEQFGLDGKTAPKGVFVREYTYDYSEYEVNHIEGQIIKVSRGLVREQKTVYIDLNSGTTVQSVTTTGIDSAGNRITSTGTVKIPTYTQVSEISTTKSRGISVYCHGSDVPTVYIRKKFTDCKKISEIYNSDGVTCDITNPLCVPKDNEKIRKYFSNRNIYSFAMRGNPALDVGDYVMLEVWPNIYKKALLLESELVFNGSFTDKVKLRIIDTDFEVINGNTYENLGKFTYEELEKFTYKQLETEAII